MNYAFDNRSFDTSLSFAMEAVNYGNFSPLKPAKPTKVLNKTKHGDGNAMEVAV